MMEMFTKKFKVPFRELITYDILKPHRSTTPRIFKKIKIFGSPNNIDLGNGKEVSFSSVHPKWKKYAFKWKLWRFTSPPIFMLLVCCLVLAIFITLIGLRSLGISKFFSWEGYYPIWQWKPEEVFAFAFLTSLLVIAQTLVLFIIFEVEEYQLSALKLKSLMKDNSILKENFPNTKKVEFSESYFQYLSILNFEGSSAWFKKGIGKDSIIRIRGLTHKDSIDKIWRRLKEMGMLSVDEDGNKICNKLEFEIIDFPKSGTKENKKELGKYLSDLWDILMVYEYNLTKLER